ncbi:LuxR C-terminal-related transcriptional regulator [Janibacter sp. G56]|uniref:helix-turn-helix transcriptional regulator n=1 Tax=Janibacter sp. G56 TaxID=3418717 RepID=UPI003D07775F
MTEDLSEGYISSVYLATINAPGSTIESLTRSGGFDAEHLPAALAVLVGRGLIALDAEGVIEVHSPDIALTAFAAEIERNAQRARLNARPLTELFRRARTGLAGATDPEAPSQIRVLESRSEVTVTLAAVAAEATETVHAFRALSPRTEDLLAHPDAHPAALHGPDGRRVTHRAVYDAEVLDAAGALNALRTRAASGEQVRLAAGIPFTMVVADETAAVIEFISTSGEGEGALLVRSPLIVRALARFLERRFNESAVLPSARDTTARGEFGTRDQLILSLLARGASDTTITRQLDVSQRTVERRIQHIMTTLGCQSRFQTGVEAARRGLV